MGTKAHDEKFVVVATRKGNGEGAGRMPALQRKRPRQERRRGALRVLGQGRPP
jgi:hypothetical protein